ncbi:unnamed protein product [Acanthosepion pharaonis]|uniref:Uncharacterized protein n=1 Tax=Acanthosepion pharaonis TaxID=158019 RepID=A0A812CVL4_ACAPH|nr:unnamed protein product [Sepia pharaonis]
MQKSPNKISLFLTFSFLVVHSWLVVHFTKRRRVQIKIHSLFLTIPLCCSFFLWLSTSLMQKSPNKISLFLTFHSLRVQIKFFWLFILYSFFVVHSTDAEGPNKFIYSLPFILGCSFLVVCSLHCRRVQIKFLFLTIHSLLFILGWLSTSLMQKSPNKISLFLTIHSWLFILGWLSTSLMQKSPNKIFIPYHSFLVVHSWLLSTSLMQKVQIKFLYSLPFILGCSFLSPNKISLFLTIHSCFSWLVVLFTDPDVQIKFIYSLPFILGCSFLVGFSTSLMQSPNKISFIPYHSLGLFILGLKSPNKISLFLTTLVFILGCSFWLVVHHSLIQKSPNKISLFLTIHSWLFILWLVVHFTDAEESK